MALIFVVPSHVKFGTSPRTQVPPQELWNQGTQEEPHPLSRQVTGRKNLVRAMETVGSYEQSPNLLGYSTWKTLTWADPHG